MTWIWKALAVVVGREVRGFGNVVIPSGILQVVDTASGRYLASVVAVYGPIRRGQQVLPLEQFGEPGTETGLAIHPLGVFTSRPPQSSCLSTVSRP